MARFNTNPRGGRPSIFDSMGCLIPTLIVFLICFAAWCTHVVYCFKTEQWFPLIAGAIAFPVAIIHGILLWFGVLG